jgi:hypothetical protein
MLLVAMFATLCVPGWADSGRPTRRLQFVAQPQDIYTSAPAGLSDVKVRVTDRHGRAVAFCPVTLDMGRNAQGLFLQGDTTVQTNSQGVADFSNIDVCGSNIDGPYMLAATAPGALLVESHMFVGWDPTP